METVRKYVLEKGIRKEVGTYERDSAWKEGEDNQYIVGINNWIVNKEGKFLVQQRALTKKNNPGKWSSTNGLIQMDEENIDTVIRETKEELGVTIHRENVILIEENHVIGNHLMVDIFVTLEDISLDDITIQESEVNQIKYVSLDELLSLDISTTCSYIKDLATKIIEICKSIEKQ